MGEEKRRKETRRREEENRREEERREAKQREETGEERRGPLLKASWLLGRLVEPLGGSWGALGSFWGRRSPKEQTSRPKWTIWGPNMGPTWHPKRTKFEDRTEHQKHSSLRSPWRCLGTILGRFGCHLGRQKHEHIIGFLSMRRKHVF